MTGLAFDSLTGRAPLDDLAVAALGVSGAAPKGWRPGWGVGGFVSNPIAFQQPRMVTRTDFSFRPTEKRVPALATAIKRAGRTGATRFRTSNAGRAHDAPMAAPLAVADRVRWRPGPPRVTNPRGLIFTGGAHG